MPNELREICGKWIYYQQAILAKEFDENSPILKELFEATQSALAKQVHLKSFIKTLNEIGFENKVFYANKDVVLEIGEYTVFKTHDHLNYVCVGAKNGYTNWIFDNDGNYLRNEIVPEEPEIFPEENQAGREIDNFLKGIKHVERGQSATNEAGK